MWRRRLKHFDASLGSSPLAFGIVVNASGFSLFMKMWQVYWCRFQSDKVVFSSVQQLYIDTGCPTILFPLCFLSFSRVLEHIQRNYWPFFSSPWNLLHNSHMNFENWFRNSLDNWIKVRSSSVCVPEAEKMTKNKVETVLWDTLYLDM